MLLTDRRVIQSFFPRRVVGKQTLSPPNTMILFIYTSVMTVLTEKTTTKEFFNKEFPTKRSTLFRSLTTPSYPVREEQPSDRLGHRPPSFLRKTRSTIHLQYRPPAPKRLVNCNLSIVDVVNRPCSSQKTKHSPSSVPVSLSID